MSELAGFLARGRNREMPPDGAFAEPSARPEVAGHGVPPRRRVTVPAKALEVEVEAVYPDAWMPMLLPYWEGPVGVTGSHPGRGYLEMTGYE